MKSKSKATAPKKSSAKVSQRRLEDLAAFTVSKFAVHAQRHVWLAVDEGADYPDSLFVNEENESHLKGVNLRTCPAYNRLIELEWQLAMAEKYLEHLKGEIADNAWNLD